ncbi:MAG: ribonuclease H-like domain-containing protein [Candidatus Krumholzibacteria bacterium]|nr:ribonuclease H-like domain-containing protein [Candidatus Krumholzibacteria bacterium]
MDLKKRLAQLDRLSRRPVSMGNPSNPHAQQDPAVLASNRLATIAELGLRESASSVGTVWSREYRDILSDPGNPLPDLREFFSRPIDFEADPREILFLDTETTGLAGGTGTIPFLVGVSWWEKGGMTTRQYFLPEPGHESAMLHELSVLAAGFRIVVTFNGASFDLPLLRTRARLNRLDDPLAELVVWDLLVPARRLYGNRLPDCRQQTLEREVCDLRRAEGDIEGSRIPQVWFDFLATGQGGLLSRVMTHNHRDMVGMGRLFILVAEAARSLDQGVDSTEKLDWLDGWALGRICERRRDTDLALACLGFSVVAAPRHGSRGLGDPRFLADALRILKRGGDWLLVERIINDGLSAGVDEPWLHREAAILYEHRLGEWPKALDHALKSGEDHRVTRLRRLLDESTS